MYFIKFWRKKEKTTFSTRIFDIYPCVFTQIWIGSTRWMGNSIPNPTSTHSTCFWQTLMPEKWEIHEKMWWWCHHHIFFICILIFRASGSAKSMLCGYSLDAELNSPSNECSHSKFGWIHREICRKYELKN